MDERLKGKTSFYPFRDIEPIGLLLSCNYSICIVHVKLFCTFFRFLVLAWIVNVKQNSIAMRYHWHGSRL